MLTFLRRVLAAAVVLSVPMLAIPQVAWADGVPAVHEFSATAGVTNSSSCPTSAFDDEDESFGDFSGSLVAASASRTTDDEEMTASAQGRGGIQMVGSDLVELETDWDMAASGLTSQSCWGVSAQMIADVDFTLTRERLVTLQADTDGDGAAPHVTIISNTNAQTLLDKSPQDFTGRLDEFSGPFSKTFEVTLPPGSYEFRITDSYADGDVNNTEELAGVAFSGGLAASLSFSDPVTPPPAAGGGSGAQLPGAGGKVKGPARPYAKFPGKLSCGSKQLVLKLKNPKSKPTAAKVAVQVNGKTKKVVKQPKTGQKVKLKKLPVERKVTIKIKVVPTKGKALTAKRAYNACA